LLKNNLNDCYPANGIRSRNEMVKIVQVCFLTAPKLLGPHPVMRGAVMGRGQNNVVNGERNQNYKQLFTYKYGGLKAFTCVLFLLN
jgi:hypothetical protein